MKTSRVFLVLGFVLMLALYSDATPLRTSSSCCSTFFPGNIPPKLITKVEKTNPRCGKRGFMVSTARNKLCVRRVFAKGK